MAKIVYLSSSTIPSRTANSVHVMKMCQAFADNGHDVELVAPDKSFVAADGAETFAFYAVRPVFKLTKLSRSKRRWGMLQYAYKAARHAQRARPDLVYGRDVQACYQAALRGLPVVLEVHDLSSVRRGLHQRVAFSMLVRASTFRYLVAISRALADDVVALYPRLAGRVRVAHDGADPVVNHDRRAVFGTGSAVLRAGYIGNIYPGRGLELLEEIARRLAWLELHVVGRWDAKLKTGNRDRALPANIRLHGFLPYANAERVRTACDVLLAPYQREVRTHGGSDTSRWMSPLKLFEYMAAGKAIVCSDLKVLREVLEHDKTAWLCPPDDIEAWCAALTALRDDAELRRRLGDSAKKAFLLSHTWKSRAAAVLQSMA
jgi:glycosyltransferase involved in cell wall biosynthesis